MKLPEYLKGNDCAGHSVKYKNWTVEYLWAEIPYLVKLNHLMSEEDMKFPLGGKVVEQITAKVFDGARSEKENRGWDIKCLLPCNPTAPRFAPTRYTLANPQGGTGWAKG